MIHIPYQWKKRNFIINYRLSIFSQEFWNTEYAKIQNISEHQNVWGFFKL